MSAPEFQLQKSIVHLLATAYPEVLVGAVPNGAALCATNDPAGRARAQREISKLKITGMLPGCPDLALWWPNGGHGLLEVKSAKGALSATQKQVIGRLDALGTRVEVVRSLQDVIDTLTEWQVPSRRVAA